ncbi:MAG: osmoprotectant transport system substrate-binding protein [Actinomycetota bacterium]|nr:osmoprotectant transport system substrate-binding protein [Actinomycetota bacterium]
MQSKPRQRFRGLALGAMVVSIVLFAAACGSDKSKGGSAGSTTAAATKIVVGEKDFPAAQLISELYGQALAAKGFKVSFKAVGPTEQTYAALKKGDIDLYGEYQGTLLTFLKGTPSGDAAAVNAALQAKVTADGVVASTPSSAVDVNAFYVTKATQQQYNLTTISDLKPVANKLVFGGPPECETRPLCLGATEKQLYGLQFKQVKKLDPGGPITVKALKDGDIQVGLLFTGSSVIDPDFVMLQDDKHLQPADNAIGVWRSSVDSPELKAVIDAVNAKLTTAEYNKLNAEISGDQKLDPKDAASQWLKDQGLV